MAFLELKVKLNTLELVFLKEFGKHSRAFVRGSFSEERSFFTLREKIYVLFKTIFATLDHQKFLLARACLNVSVTSTFLRATQLIG